MGRLTRLETLWKITKDNRDTHPLFNNKRFTRNLEAAYTTMWEIWQRGEPPRSFSC
jgi:predicted O-linked N-acetylglucosamine transferase (SPINDLY family)